MKTLAKKNGKLAKTLTHFAVIDDYHNKLSISLHHKLIRCGRDHQQNKTKNQIFP
jgi:hypothetical protein